MKLIAHRGASLERPENSLESLTYAAELGAFAAECDVRQTLDGKYVIFHDDDLKRLGGDPRQVSSITEAEMRSLIEKSGHILITLDNLLTGYRNSTPILLHIKLPNPDEAFFRRLYDSPVNFICGVQSLEAAEICRKVFPSEQILAFMPNMYDYNMFYKAGAGIIRLWENWLTKITPDEVRSVCPNAEVFIMANRSESGMNGTPESLYYIDSLHADGVLLNDIKMALGYNMAKNK